jgi:hypothetical protein
MLHIILRLISRLRENKKLSEWEKRGLDWIYSRSVQEDSSKSDILSMLERDLQIELEKQRKHVCCLELMREVDVMRFRYSVRSSQGTLSDECDPTATATEGLN